MTGDALELYQRAILGHNRKPRNTGPLDKAPHAEGNNPICGDRVTVYVGIADDVVTRATFEGLGCAICIASASLMTESVRGKTLQEVAALSGRLRDLVTGAPDSPLDDLGDLTALAGVRRFPVRAMCALLPWQALHAALSFSPKL